MAENTTRPPTPVGWSDTDWIKHLQEQKEPHPLAGLHLNQGSMDAAADAYEAEYNAARRGGRALDVVTLTGEEYDAMIERIATMHEALRGIAAADWREWQELASAEEFVRWAKSRALHALTPNVEFSGEGKRSLTDSAGTQG